MQKLRRRLLSGLLAFAVTLSCFSTAAFAAADGPAIGKALYENGFDSTESIADWTISGQTAAAENGVLQVSSTGTVLCYTLPEGIESGNYTVTAKMDVTKSDINKGSSAGLVFRLKDETDFLHFRVNVNKAGGEVVQLYGFPNGDGKLSLLAEKPFDWSNNTEYCLAATANGEKIRCYVDDVLLIEYSDPNYNAEQAGAGIGLRLYGCSTNFDDLKVYALDETAPAVELETPENGELLPADVGSVAVSGTVSNAENAGIQINGGAVEPLTLEDGRFSYELTDLSTGNYTLVITASSADGRTASAQRSFRVASEVPESAYTFEDGLLTDWTGDAGQYTVADRGGNKVLQGSHTGSALLLAPNAPDSDSYCLTAHAGIIASPYTGAGIVFRYTDSSNYWLLRMEIGGKISLQQNKNGTWAVHGTSPFGWDVGQMLEVTIAADGPYIRCYANGELLFETVDSEYRAPQQPGGIGVQVEKCTAQFDNLFLSGVAGPEVTVTVPESPVTEMPVVISGTAVGASSVEVRIQNEETVVRTLSAQVVDGGYSCETYLPSGTYTAEVTGTSLGGNGVSEPVKSEPFVVELPATELLAEPDQDTGIPVSGPVRLYFSAPVNPDTLTGIALKKGDVSLEADVTMDPNDQEGRTVILTPKASMEAASVYQVVISAAVADVMGNTVGEEIVLSFQTRRDINTLPPLKNDQGQVELSLNGMWSFTTDPDDVGQAQGWYTLENTEGWDSLPVPGNWDLENAYANYKGTGWYGRTFTMPAEYEGYPAYLNLTAVYHDSRIWINGREVGSHDGGYTTFEFRVDDYLNYGGENTIAIQVNNELTFGAWWKWGGISGDALLRVNNVSKIEWQHITSEPNLEDDTAQLTFQYKINNQATEARIYTVVSDVYDKATGEVVGTTSTEVVVQPTTPETEDQRFDASLTLENVKLWHFDTPNLYTVKTRIMDGDTILHTVEDNIGIRKIEIIDTKFYLNGEQVCLTGANRVWDDRANGGTEPDYVIMRDVDYMKSMGMNCARLSHVPMSKNLLDYCDQVGFLLICEGNVWGDGAPGRGGVAEITNPPGSEYPYRASVWYKEMIERDYNHPSIFAWSIGNELKGAQENVKQYAVYMRDFIKTELDDTRFVIEVSNTGHKATKPEDDSMFMSDFLACNSYGGFASTAAAYHRIAPDKALFITEYGSKQTSEIPDKAVITPRSWLDQYGTQTHVFGASIWTLNDYRSNYSGTPLGQNRAWGVTTVWGDKKIGFESLREASSRVKKLSVEVSGDTDREGGSAIARVTVQSRNIENELPAYPIRGAVLKWETYSSAGSIISSGLIDIPDIQDDGSSWETAVAIQNIPSGGIGALRVTVIDALGYEIAEAYQYLQASSETPEITGVVAAGDALRVLFDDVENAESYRITLTGDGVNKSATANLNRYADFTGLKAGETYSVTISAANSAGSGPVSAAVEAATTTDSAVLPPIIWHTEPIEGAFFVGYSVKSADDTYELEYGTQSGSYTQSMTFGTEGSVKVSGLEDGQTYYYRLRSVTDGVPSAWSQEVAVTVETADQAREVPVVKGAAGGKTSVSLTIDPSWKATGYVVKYGESAEQLDNRVTIQKAEVEQLTIDGLDTGKTYWFSVASLNGEVCSEFSQPVSAATTTGDGQHVILASVETTSLPLNKFSPEGRITITATSTFEEEKTLSVKAEGLPEGIHVPADAGFTVAANGTASFTLPVTMSEDVESGWYTVVISVLSGDTVLDSREVELVVNEGTEMLLEDNFSEIVEGRYTQSGTGGTAEIADDVLTINGTNTKAIPIITAGEKDWSGYVIESDMSIVEKGAAGLAMSAGIIFRYQDDKNFYHVRVDLGANVSNPTFQIYRWKDSKTSLLFARPISGEWNDSHKIRVEDEGSTVYFYLDGTLMTALNLGEGGGKVGYRAYGAVAQMDNLKVYKMERPQADKTELQSLVERCKAYSAQDYTEESFADLQTSLNEALAVLEDEFATQPQVDEALEALEAAEEALEPTSDGTSVPTYRPETETGGHGTVTVSPLFPRQGQTVTITPKPEEGYELESLTVTDRNGKPVEVTEQADGTWKFTQPAGKVTITAEFAPVEPITFYDVEAGSWYEAAVNAMVEAGLMQGTGNNMFQPFGTVTRATMWTILARMDGVDTEGGSSWYEKAQAWAVAEGVSDGTNSDAVVTREQIAAMLYRYAGSPAAENALDFADSGDISDWAADAMAWAVAEGILTGKSGNILDPDGTATRAEAATILMRFCQSIKK